MRGWNNNPGTGDASSKKPYRNGHNAEPPARPAYMPPKPSVSTPVEHTPSPDFKPSDTSDLKAGQKVEHQKFGFGVVVKMEGASHNPIATIRFELNGEKKIMLNYAKIRIVN
jgi:DNA helicase-2/ATP-dependent DNA helicase PcrA